MTTAIIYASTNGNTKAVAEYIAGKTGGKAVDVKNADTLDLNDYDTVVIGGRVWAGSLPGALVKYIENNKNTIEGKNRALFLCCIYNGEKGQNQCDKIASELGFEKHDYFNKGKKIVLEPGNKVDDFISRL
ncbi:MAG: flavodoxin domain-containing protein [archaeon]|nr:flavodoxin domain-containing protein [archaeon]